MATEKRLIDYDMARNATYEELLWTESEQAVVRHFLAKIPKVDAVEVVHGRWEAYKPEARGYAFGFICSNCCDVTYLDYAQKECDYNYCPNCGAKMDRERKDNVH